jgi:TolB-like protein
VRCAVPAHGTPRERRASERRPPAPVGRGESGTATTATSSDLLRSVVAVTRRRLHVVAVSLAALLAIVALMAWRMTGWFGGRTITSLAILPFTCVGESRDVGYLGQGLSESLTSGLRPLPHLHKVIASSAVSRYNRPGVDPRRVGRDLDVEAVLTGRVIQRGAMLELNTELVSVSDGREL